MTGWLGVVIMMVLGVGFAAVMIGLSILLGPKNPTPEKLAPYECGMPAVGDCFFQKHASKGFPASFKPIRIKEKSGSDIYLYIEDVRGLVAAVQMGALELHIWGSH